MEKHFSVTQWQGYKFSVLYLRMGGFLGSFKIKRKDFYGMNKPQLQNQIKQLGCHSLVYSILRFELKEETDIKNIKQ